MNQPGSTDLQTALADNRRNIEQLAREARLLRQLLLAPAKPLRIRAAIPQPKDPPAPAPVRELVDCRA
jgi:hypothetical protein